MVPKMTLDMGKTLLLNGTISDASLKIYHIVSRVLSIYSFLNKLMARSRVCLSSSISSRLTPLVKGASLLGTGCVETRVLEEINQVVPPGLSIEDCVYSLKSSPVRVVNINKDSCNVSGMVPIT